MKSSKKALLALVCAAALVFGSMFATYAYLTDSASVTNTFTVGNVGIALSETTGDKYKMVPGVAIDKDPIVTVEEGSEDCWVFLKVDKMGGNVTVGEGSNAKSYDFDDFIAYQIDSHNWTELKLAGIDVDGVYYTKYESRDDDIKIKVLGEGSETENGYTVFWGLNQVATKASVTKEMMDAFDENSNGVLDENEKENLPQLKFIAYAVQYAGFEDKPADAWAVIPDEEKD